MYCVVDIKGHQYKLKAGDIVDVQKIDQEQGSEVNLDRVLLVADKEDVKVGTPVVEGAALKAKVIRQARSRKVIVFRRSPGKYRKKNGHRQHYTSLLITEVNNGAGGVSKIDESSETAKKYLSK